MRDGREKWERLADAIRVKIASGEYPVDAKIPTVRQLMEEHDLSDNTVSRALAQLADEGLVEGRVGAGTFVIGVPDQPAMPAADLVVELRAALAEQGQRLDAMEERLLFVERRLGRPHE